MKLKDKVVIISGASTGLGKATAVAFANEGANVVMVARRPEKLYRAAEDLKALGTNVLAVPTDVSKFEQIERMGGYP